MLVSMKMKGVPPAAQAGRTPVGRAAARANERWEETASELPKVSSTSPELSITQTEHAAELSMLQLLPQQHLQPEMDK